MEMTKGAFIGLFCMVDEDGTVAVQCSECLRFIPDTSEHPPEECLIMQVLYA